jgi:hypothetical protein
MCYFLRMSSVVIWPLHKHHFLTVPLIHIDAPLQCERSSDYRTIIEAVGASWMPVRDIAAKVQAQDLGTVSKHLSRATNAGILERQRVKFEWRTCWGYRKREAIL